ncbi:MAG TPA: sialate O-acetylesterase, partial [Chitinophagaceae bacterium]|nr:sialate O-acetylesterase [Chitinophagaceae bacterium]
AVIGSHMVLQQKTEVTIWGWCDAAEKIKLGTNWDTTTYTTVGSSSARWSMQIKTPAAGGPYQITIEGHNKIVLEDVLIGEVWVCSGQSNMEMNVSWGLPYQDDVANATDKNIRFFHIPHTTADYPQDDVKAEWVVCNPDDMKRFSAAGYFFGKTLRENLNVPVGLINASWGGTPAEVWTPIEFINGNTTLKAAAGKLSESIWWPVNPAATYNGMLSPITKFTIAGAIWYQGESNVKMASTYTELMTTMINAWRKSWQKDFPFYFVQIAPFAGYGDNSSSAFLREAQTKALATPNTGMVVVTDLVDNINDIHPKMKKQVGVRLANYALAETYGKKGIVYKSAFYKNMKVEKNKIRIYFDNADNGLISKDKVISEFFIAGQDQNFVPANVKIERSTVVVWNDTLKNPIAVRFAFRNASLPNLFSKEGLPVNSFRTDDWPVDIVIKK